MGADIALDDMGDVYVTGWTTSDDFPIQNPFGLDNLGGQDAFVAKLKAREWRVDLYSAFRRFSSRSSHGGLRSIRDKFISPVKPNLLIFPITGQPFDSQFNNLDAFVAIISGTTVGTGSALSYSTFLGGTSEDIGNDIAVDNMGAIYIAGQTASSDFFPIPPTSFDRSLDIVDGFLVKLIAGQTTLAYGTFLGGHTIDDAKAIALDQTGHVYVTGSTESFDFPITTTTTANAFDDTYNDNGDAFVVKIAPNLTNGQDLIYATFLGGNNVDIGHDIAVDSGGNAYVIGNTFSADLPTVAGVPRWPTIGVQVMHLWLK